MRMYMEAATGIYTSSDMNLEVTLKNQMCGQLGEEHADSNLTWITKTHWPSPINREKFHAQKMIVVVRNPIDVLPSFCGLLNTMSHSLTPQRPYNELTEFWDSFIKFYVPAIKQNFEGVEKLSETIPTHYVRFEDMRTEPARVLCEMFCFLYEVKSIEGTILEKRILEKCASGSGPKAAYKLKSTSTSLCRNAHMYTDEQLDFIKTELKDQLYYFGYVENPDEEHNTPFFKFESHEDEDLDNFKMFESTNERSLLDLTIMSEERKIPDYHFNSGDFM